MTRAAMDRALCRRAAHIAHRLAPFLPPVGGTPLTVLDIGCGTGHNAEALRGLLRGPIVTEADVADLHSPGTERTRPALILNGRLPFADAAFDAALLLFVLHYPADPVALLREARRVTRSRLIVLQSTHQGRWSRGLLACREWAQGRAALRLAGCVGMVSSAMPRETLRPATLMDRPRLHEVTRRAGWRVARTVPEYWPLTRLSRDLLVLEPA